MNTVGAVAVIAGATYAGSLLEARAASAALAKRYRYPWHVDGVKSLVDGVGLLPAFSFVQCFEQMKTLAIAKHGASTAATAGKYAGLPAAMSRTELLVLCEVWLGAMPSGGETLAAGDFYDLFGGTPDPGKAVFVWIGKVRDRRDQQIGAINLLGGGAGTIDLQSGEVWDDIRELAVAADDKGITEGTTKPATLGDSSEVTDLPGIALDAVGGAVGDVVGSAIDGAVRLLLPVAGGLLLIYIIARHA